MLLTSSDKQTIMNRFPDIELSYDNILHKKVLANLYTLIPSGKKCLIWFTYIKNKNVCLLLELNKCNNIVNLHYQTYCFDSELSYNTILYGTYNKINNNTFFTCEDILYYKNQNTQNLKFNKKLNILTEFFLGSIKNTSLCSNNLILTMPIIKSSYDEAIKASQCVSYNVYGIQFIDFKKSEPLGTMRLIKNTTEVIFKVKADLRQDIYNLYCSDKGSSETLYGIATIPDYKTSIFMNTLFRTIKENRNLDLLEESDSDSEFEDVREDKFVDLEKTLFMRCVYIPRFRKWKPVSVVNSKSSRDNKDNKDSKGNKCNYDNPIKIISKKELCDLQRQTQKYNNY